MTRTYIPTDGLIAMYKLKPILMEDGFYNKVKSFTTFRTTRYKYTLGAAYFQTNEIGLNSHLFLVDNRDQLRDTFIHELCHLMSYTFFGDHAHGDVWKKMCKRYGCAPTPTTTEIIYYDADPSR